MKERFLDSLTYNLIDKYKFMPLRNEEGAPYINSPVRILESSAYSGLTLVELIDGDVFDAEQIRNILNTNTERLDSVKSRGSVYLFEAFVFQDTPAADKLEAISAGQNQKPWNKRYLSCFTVDLSNKEAASYDLSKTDKVVKKAIDECLAHDIEPGSTNFDIIALLESKKKEYTIEFSSKVPVLTYALIAVNIAVWMLLQVISSAKGIDYSVLLTSFGAKDNLKIMAGEYWRLLTPVFLHANYIHLAVNCFSLYQVGVLVERIYGNTKFCFVYFVAGIFGNIASFMFSVHGGVGASGAIFGLMGALLYFGIENPKQFKHYFGYSIVVTILINAYIGYSQTNIDNFAHIGGLIGGFLAAGIVQLKGAASRFLKRPVFITVTLLAFVLSLYYGFTCSQNVIAVKVEALENISKEQKWSEAEKLGIEILGKNPRDKNARLRTLWVLVVADASQGRYDKAFEYADTMKQVDEARGSYLKGALYFDTQNYEQAEKELEAAKKLDPELSKVVDDLISELNKVKSK